MLCKARPAAITQGGYFVFLRAVKPAEVDDAQSLATDRSLKGLPLFNDQRADELAEQMVQGLTPHLSDTGTAAVTNVKTEIRNILRDVNEEHVVTFAAVGIIKPLESKKTFTIQLVGYQYPALKARNTVNLCVGGWHKTESILNVLLEGPSADPDYNGGRFQVQVAFNVPWDRDGAIKGQSDWIRIDDTDSGYISKPIAVPRAEDFVLTITLLESSDMNKTLSRISEQVGKLAGGG